MTWMIKGHVTGQYGTKLRVRAHYIEDGTIAGETVVEGNADYEIETADYKPCYLLLLPEIGLNWRPGRLHIVGEKVYPNNYKAVPYYFVCTGRGITAPIEPNFTSDPFAPTKDGTCVWERGERLPYPFIKYPIIPEITP